MAFMRTCKHSADAKLRWKLCTLNRWERMKMNKKVWDGDGGEAKKRGLHSQASAERPYRDLPALFLCKFTHAGKHLSLQTVLFHVLMHLMPLNIKQINPFLKALSTTFICPPHPGIPLTLCSSVPLTMQSFHSLDPKPPLLQLQHSAAFLRNL